MSVHKALAEKHLGFVQEFDTQESRDWPLVNATVAQAEATLALVEQQRIANLIAYVEAQAAIARDGFLPSDETRARAEAAATQVVEGLSL